VLLVVMDGVGIGRKDRGDAVWLARTPAMDRLAAGSWLPLKAHGRAVGLPSDKDMGNSEVGHNILGAGRVFDQGATLVDAALDSGAAWGETWDWLLAPCARGAGGGAGGAGTPALHLLGLLSDGNVHSHEKHVHTLLRRAAQDGCRRIYVHTLLDGRDVPETSSLVYLDRLESVLAGLRAEHAGLDARIASGGGRMLVTMDRYEADWSIVERGWHAHVLGDARRFPSARSAVESYRAEKQGLSDQFLPPFVVEPVVTVGDGDAVLFFNFRGDRAIEISRAFVEDGFAKFDRVRRPAARFAGMMQYDGDTQMPPRFLVQPPAVERPVSEYLARAGISQFACAETQKFGHVTYFWNGNRSGAFDPATERYLELPSDRVPFEQRPWMKAAEVTDAVLAALRAPKPPRFLRVNFANGDMVGHTGDLEATVQAVEAVDLALRRILPEIEHLRGAALVTADHGNADQMFAVDEKSGEYTAAPLTSHTTNPVPCYLVDPAGGARLRADPKAGLANVAATLLELLGLEPPADYERSLLAP
jgi:2,3-bisphosphoglycerate-independent phosphoglycerate mutase